MCPLLLDKICPWCLLWISLMETDPCLSSNHLVLVGTKLFELYFEAASFAILDDELHEKMLQKPHEKPLYCHLIFPCSFNKLNTTKYNYECNMQKVHVVWIFRQTF